MDRMKAKEIQELFNSFESIAIEYDGVDCWSARELAPAMAMLGAHNGDPGKPEIVFAQNYSH